MLISVHYDKWLPNQKAYDNCWVDDPEVGHYEIRLAGKSKAMITDCKHPRSAGTVRHDYHFTFSMTFEGVGYLNQPLKAETLEEAKNELEEFLLSLYLGHKKQYEKSVSEMHNGYHHLKYCRACPEICNINID